MTGEKYVDESWKDSVASEKDQKQDISGQSADSTAQKESGEGEVNFMNYVASLTFQAMIFLGEIPNPMAENKIEKNLAQAKLLIDTLTLLREKTKGNLTKQEEDLLNGSVYELQMKYVAQIKGEKA